MKNFNCSDRRRGLPDRRERPRRVEEKIEEDESCVSLFVLGFVVMAVAAILLGIHAP